MPASTALVVLNPGFEEMEAVAPIDILRRADVKVTVASLCGEKAVVGRNHISIGTDIDFDAVKERIFDALVLPGGPGTMTMRKNEALLQSVRAHVAAEKCVAAICAAPVVLLDAGVLGDHKRTCHASVAQECAPIVDYPVVEDGLFITSRGAGTADAFALTIAARLCGPAAADKVAASIHFE